MYVLYNLINYTCYMLSLLATQFSGPLEMNWGYADKVIESWLFNFFQESFEIIYVRYKILKFSLKWKQSPIKLANFGVYGNTSLYSRHFLTPVLTSTCTCMYTVTSSRIFFMDLQLDHVYIINQFYLTIWGIW